MEILDKKMSIYGLDKIIKRYIEKIENSTNLTISYNNDKQELYTFLKVYDEQGFLLYECYNSLDTLLFYLKGMYHTIYDIKEKRIELK